MDREKAEVNRIGKRMVQIALQRGDPDEFEDLCHRLQPLLLDMVRDRCLAEGLPLPPYLVAGKAVEFGILEGCRKPTTRFYDILNESLGVAIEFFKMRRLFVDRYIVGTRGGRVRKQACVAAICEAALAFPLRDRQILYHWILDYWPTDRIAAQFGIAELDVRLALARIVKAARPFVDSWLARWELPEDTKKRRRQRPRNRPQ
jgi:hypothetical protein